MKNERPLVNKRFQHLTGIYQQKAVDIARQQLEALGVDISDMPDRTVMTHLIVLQVIADDRGMTIDDALAEYAHKFGNLGALNTEVVAPDDETRH